MLQLTLWHILESKKKNPKFQLRFQEYLFHPKH